MTRSATGFFAALCLLFVFAATSLPAQDWAKAALEKSPRHREYVPLKHGDRTVQAFVVYPEVSHKAPVIITDPRDLRPQRLGQGNGRRTRRARLHRHRAGPAQRRRPQWRRNRRLSRPGCRHQRGLRTRAPTRSPPIWTRPPTTARSSPPPTARSMSRASAGAEASRSPLPPIATILAAAFVFYGTPPPDADMKNITAPVYGFYAGNDARISATVPATTAP